MTTIEPRRPTGAKAWIILVLTVPAVLWIEFVLWVVDREQLRQTRAWFFGER